MIGAVILAAGAGRRLGGVCKALLPAADGASFLATIARSCAAAGVAPVVVVVGPPHEAATRAEAARLGLAVVVNPAPDRGMASSIAVGFAAAAGALPAADAALLWPVDHARVAAATVAALCRAATAEAWVIPRHGGRGGHPVAVGRALWPELAACADAAAGARAVRDRHPERVRHLEVSDRGVLLDADTVAEVG